MVRRRRPADGRAGNRHRGRCRRALAVLAKIRARRRRSHLWQAEPRQDRRDPGRSRKALLAGKIVSYAQGFAVINKASEEFGWSLPLATIAKIWRAGCIIRSRFLDQMSSAYAKGEATNLLVVPDFVGIMKDSHPSLRKVVAAASVGEFPMICLSASLSYFDSYRQAQGTANLTQGQRDFFGAHGFEIEGRGSDLHGTWPSTLGK